MGLLYVAGTEYNSGILFRGMTMNRHRGFQLTEGPSMRRISASAKGLLLALAVGLSLGMASRICAATPSSQPVRDPAGDKAVAELMGQLGHRDFQRREAATRRLIEIGEASRPLLEATATQPDLDPEVADRIRTVLTAIGRRTVKLSDKVSMELVRIPAGKFLMGSPENEKDRHAEESPRHEVTISGDQDPVQLRRRRRGLERPRLALGQQ